MNYDMYETMFGLLLIKEDGIGLNYVGLYDKEHITEKDVRIESSLIKETKKQLKEYFASERTSFDLPLHPTGTPFQLRVWYALCNIPYGETRSYQQIAEGINCPKGCRAVGLANNKNPIVIIIPCHRVIGKNGSLVGYALGLERKQKLLSLENLNR